jgi:hypothetical protein
MTGDDWVKIIHEIGLAAIGILTAVSVAYSVMAKAQGDKNSKAIVKGNMVAEENTKAIAEVHKLTNGMSSRLQSVAKELGRKEGKEEADAATQKADDDLRKTAHKHAKRESPPEPMH